MQSNFSVLHDHLAEACRVRKITHDRQCNEAVELHFAGLRALDVYRLAQIADRLEVSLDWLLGRSEEMELPKKIKVRKRA
jgi:hypothetical protein